MEVKFEVKGDPVPWTVQVRKAERSQAFQRMQAWQTQIQAAARVAWTGKGREQMTGPVDIRIVFHIKKRGPDTTNMFKAAEDAMQGIVYVNDSQSDGICADRVIDGSLREGWTFIHVEELK